MKKSILALVGIIIFLSICAGTSGAADTDDEYEITDAKYLNRPFTLQDAVDEIKWMMEQGKPNWEIAKRAATIADGRIVNANPGTYEFHTWPSNWLWPLLESHENKVFDDWRMKQTGADKQYTDQAKWAWNNKYGQCSENSCLVYYLLKEAGAKNVRLFGQGDPDHAFVVWGMDEEADPKDPASWTNNVIVPDGWQGRVLRGSKAFNNKYCGHGGQGVEDITHMRDHSAKPRCGYRSLGNMKYPCCKKAPYAPCRGDRRLVCRNDACVSCGSINKYCCEGEKCNFSNLECKDDRCVEKEEQVQEAYIPPECVGASGYEARVECMFEVSKRNDLTECYKTTDPELKNWCFYWMAQKRGDISLCYKIADDKIATWCRGEEYQEPQRPQKPGEEGSLEPGGSDM